MRQFLRLVQASSVIALAVSANVAMAQANDTSPEKQATSPASSNENGKSDIVVIGVRGSVETATKKKKNSKQIVDSVVAEDAGKLPDNNVVEALARVPGVNITRSQGQGDGLTIRGLDGIQTTINGSEVAGAGSRTLSLSDIPAELIKSVSVYKTRTADQVEGGIGGSINVELRRPLDLKKGLTVAGSFRESYNSQGNTWSPYASLLLADHFDTGIGEMGFLINAGYQNVAYNEPYLYSESPYYFYDIQNPDNTFRSHLYQSLPAGVRDEAVAPYRGAYGINEGRRKLPSISAVGQWKPSDRLNVVLEGSYFGSRTRDQYNSLFVLTRQDYYSYENPVFGKSGALQSATITNGDQTINNGDIDAGVNSGQSTSRSDSYHTNLEVHWNAPGVRLDVSTQYDWSKNTYYSNGYEGRFVDLERVGVNFNSPAAPAGGPSFDFFDVDITDPAQQRIFALFDNIGLSKSTQFAAQADLSVDVSSSGLLRNIQLGARFRRSTNRDQSSYRYANWGDPATRPTLDSLPGVSLRNVTPDINGGQPLSWAQLNTGQLYDNWPAVTRFIIDNDPSFLDGPGRNAGVASHFANPRPSSEDPVFTGGVNENVFSAYGTLNYAFKAGFPIDGQVGLRYVNTYGSFSGNSLLLGRPDTANPGEFLPDEIVRDSSRANYVDLLPSVFAVVHFTPKLQLRASYNYNVQRPAFQSLRSYRNVFVADPNATIYAGNPELKPTTSDDFNLSLEYYFGRGGIISVNGFVKKQKGFIYETRQQQPVPELGGAVRFVQMPRNAGPGETRGVEFQATSFFSFLPGALKNFGATFNATWIPTARLSLPYEIDPENQPGVYGLSDQVSPFTSKLSYNIIGYYETGVLSARVAYNWRSKFKTGVDAINQTYITSSPANSRLDAAINVTPVPYLTLSIEAQNLLNTTDKYYYTQFPDLPNGFRQMGRTIQGGARFRF